MNVLCNSSWSAEVDAEKTTARGVSIETVAGEGNVEGFVINVAEANTDFDNTKDIVIKFHMEDETDGEICLLQQKGSILCFEFMVQDCDKKNWVFEGSSPDSENKGQGSFRTPGGDYVLGYSASSRCYLHSNGFQCGDQVQDYIELPAIPGRRLIRVTDTDSNGSTKPSIVDKDSNVVKGGEYRSEFKKMTPFTWILEDTLPGESYRILSGNKKTQRINTLELEYE